MSFVLSSKYHKGQRGLLPPGALRTIDGGSAVPTFQAGHFGHYFGGGTKRNLRLSS